MTFARVTASILLALGAALVVACGTAPARQAAAPQAEPPPPPTSAPAPAFSLARDWPVRPGWTSETIDFPLPFAPTLTHRGTEELRFAPDMFDPAAPGYWSYAFVWWTEDEPPSDPSAIAAELTIYFRGLLAEVATARRDNPGKRPPPAAFDVEQITAALRPNGVRVGWTHSTGEATIFDAFGDGRQLRLLLTVARRQSVSAGRYALLVLASPASREQLIWGQLQDAGMQAAGRIPK